MASDLDDAASRLAELQYTFDLRWKADRRATERWRAAAPGRDLTIPDHADLCVWLLEQLEANGSTAEKQLLAEIRDLEETIRDATGNLISLLQDHPDGFGVDRLGPFYVVRKPTDHPNYKGRHDAALDHVVDAVVERYTPKSR
jgi:hypothetical protein